MEIKARYLLIGLFVLAMIVAGFRFVYWLETIGGQGEQAVYHVRFEHTVSGLRAGSAVLFNGVRIGDVTGIDLDPNDPAQVTVTIAVQRSSPLRADTLVDIETQGLMGAPSLQLQGGSAAAPSLDTKQVLIAGSRAGVDTMQTARDVLRRIDSLVAENSNPLHATIANLETFSGALARNADRIDGILTGVERMTGAGPPSQPPAIVSLTAPRAFQSLESAQRGQLIVPEPSALLMFDTQKVLVWPEGPEGGSLAGVQWSDNLPKLLQSKMIESLENAGSFAAVARSTEGFSTDFQLLIDVRAFQISPAPEPRAMVEFSAKLLGQDGKVLGTRIFRSTAPVPSMAAAMAASALDRAFGEAAVDLVLWTSTLI